MNSPRRLHEYPNVKIRLRLAKTGPDLPDREYYMDIWLKEMRFHVCDEAGRDISTLLGDLTAQRGLGQLPQSMEDIMDIWSEEQDPDRGTYGVTNLYGDLQTGSGWVFSWHQEGWPIEAETIAPIAEQVLIDELEQYLTPTGPVTRLGKAGTEYHGFWDCEQAGFPFKSEVTCIIAPPYRLLSQVHDVRLTNLSYIREIVTLEEDVVTEADVTPPE